MKWLATALLLLIVAAPTAFWATLVTDDRTLSGIRVEGADFPPLVEPGPEVLRRANQWLDATIAVRSPGKLHRFTRRELGARIDIEELVSRLRSVGHSGDPFEDGATWWDARRGQIDFQWRVAVESAVLEARIEALRHEIDRIPKSTRFHANGTVAENGWDGRFVDVDLAQSRITHALLASDLLVELPIREEPMPYEPPEELVLDAVLGTFVTRYRPRERGRSHNVQLAAGLLDGAVIAPGGILSFNHRVGPRTRTRGYRLAPQIQDGIMVDGIGGGVCQVASTLHAAAFYGGFEISEHVPHSRPSSYIPTGLDATVSWPSLDLQIRNPFPSPVVVRTSADRGSLKIDLIGRDAGWAVEVDRRVLARSSFEERIIEDPEAPPGTDEVVEEGIRGVTVRRRRTIVASGGPRVEERIIRYPPTDRVRRVAVGEAEGDVSDVSDVNESEGATEEAITAPGDWATAWLPRP
ncbi:MAG: VanW family protein [Myxococcota bacterium]